MNIQKFFLLIFNFSLFFEYSWGSLTLHEDEYSKIFGQSIFNISEEQSASEEGWKTIFLKKEEWKIKFLEEFGEEPWCPKQNTGKFQEMISKKDIWKKSVVFSLYSSHEELFSPPNTLKEIFSTNLFYFMGMELVEKKGLKYLEYASAKSHPDANYKLFLKLFKERTIKNDDDRNHDDMRIYLIRAAMQDHKEAIYTISNAYEGYWGRLFKKNLTLSLATCKLAASLGHKEAEFSFKIDKYLSGRFKIKSNFIKGIRKALALEKSNVFASNLIRNLNNSSKEYILYLYPKISDNEIDFLRLNIRWIPPEDRKEIRGYEEKIKTNSDLCRLPTNKEAPYFTIIKRGNHPLPTKRRQNACKIQGTRNVQ